MIAVRAYNRCQSCQQSVTAVHILLLAELSGIWFIFIVITFPVFVSAWKIVIWGIICISCDKTEVWNGRGPQSPKSESLVFVFQPCYRVQYLLFICFLSSKLCVLSLVAKLSGFTYTPLSQNQPAQYCHLNDQGPLRVNFGKTTMTAAAGRSLLFNQHWRPASSIAKSNGAQRAFLCLARSGDGPAKTCKEIEEEKKHLGFGPGYRQRNMNFCIFVFSIL